MSESISVYARFRPNKYPESTTDNITYVDDSTVEISTGDGGNKIHSQEWRVDITTRMYLASYQFYATKFVMNFR